MGEDTIVRIFCAFSKLVVGWLVFVALIFCLGWVPSSLFLVYRGVPSSLHFLFIIYSPFTNQIKKKVIKFD